MADNDKGGDLVIRINNKTLLAVALSGMMLLLVYSIGRANGLSSKTPLTPPSTTLQASPTPSPTQSPSPTPKQVQTIQKIISPSPTSKVKVSVMIDDGGGINKGNYYCYEDKANELANLQSQIRIKEAQADGCNYQHQDEVTRCMMGCTNGDNTCTHNCAAPYLDSCGDTAVGNMRQELTNKIRQYCP